MIKFLVLKRFTSHPARKCHTLGCRLISPWQSPLSVAFSNIYLFKFLTLQFFFFSTWWFHATSWLSGETTSLYWGLICSLYYKNFNIHSGLSSLLLVTIRHLLALLCSSKIPTVRKIYNTARNSYMWKNSIVYNSCYLKSIYFQFSTFIKYFYKI